ncbi:MULTISPECIES: DUF4394 domain-containing protein [Kamptonema]|uniref:DUF4394 domain-containing protein n=1 Tax=Kamptonema TaxID=1501433 RepID=UPI0001DACD11|nr:MULTISPECIES: DUF4394 domain-containing protein [Kamptonema]CBN53942.1 hypothetical protein OSCI_380004 [Kamptonema sp. PCC 6506]
MAEIIGTPQADSIGGLPEDDRIFGLQENDTISGNSGNDSIYGGKENDFIDGNSGSDSLFGDLDNDTVNGNEDNDSIYGGRGNDLLAGNSGSDVLFGDRGADNLTGGEGADVFVLTRYADGGPSLTSGGLSLADADVINDFTDNLDLIGLSGGLTFADLNLVDAGNNTFIQDRVTGEFLAVLAGVNRSLISAADFTTNNSSVVPSPLPGPSITAYGLTASNRIVGFNTFAPGITLRDVSVTGLESGESLVGIDFRPANGQLFGLGSSNRLYRIDPISGAATAVGTAPFNPTLTSGATGFDFNPTVDRIRAINEADQNARLNPDTGGVVDFNTTTDGIQLDGSLAYASGDRNSGANPSAVGAAYTNNFAGATSTTLYAIDSNLDVLVRQVPPNDGVLNTVGSLGVDASSVLGFDIRSVGGQESGYAALNVGGVSSLYNINLTTGQATALGQITNGEAIVGLALPLPTAYAVTGRDGAERIIGFNAAAPQAVLSDVAVTGLLPGESLLGIDFRPATGVLYGLGSSNRLYAIDRASGVATVVGTAPLNPTLTIGATGFDFNPTVDRIRVINEADQNGRLNQETGAVVDFDTLIGGVQFDRNLVYAAGDINAGANPTAVAAAYTNNFAGATSTTLYAIDSGLDVLVRQVPPNDGVLNTVGSLGVDASRILGFDISPNGNAIAALEVGGVSSLYNINLTTGAATAIGQIGNGTSVKGLALTLI